MIKKCKLIVYKCDKCGAECRVEVPEDVSAVDRSERNDEGFTPEDTAYLPDKWGEGEVFEDRKTFCSRECFREHWKDNEEVIISAFESLLFGSNIKLNEKLN